MRASYIFLLCSAAFLCGSFSSATLFDDTLRECTEFLRLQMHCGYPARGVPILAPLEVAYKELDIQTGSLSFKGNFTELSIAGLDGFEFSKLSWSNIKHTITFDVNFPSIKLNSANYKLDIGRTLWGDGVFDLELIDLRAFGSFVIRPLTTSEGVYIKSWKVNWELGEAKSALTGIMGSRLYTKFMNDLFKEFLELLINDNPAEIAKFMESIIVPPANLVLVNVNWYEIAAIIMGLVEGVLPVEPIC